MQELDEIKLIFKNNILKIVLFLIFTAIMFYIFLFLSLWKPYTITDIKENVKQAVEFKGYPVSKAENTKIKNNILNPARLHNNFIIYGATETGKTTFMEKYISSYYEKENVYIYCMDLDEWKDFPNVYEGNEETLDMLDDMKTFKGTKEKKKFNNFG